MSYTRRVSVIIPCRNEEASIAACLGSLLASDYPRDMLEILVVDGMSEDSTRKIVEFYVDQYPFVKLLENPKKIASSALNIGIENATGEVILRADAHAGYPKDYISKCVEALSRYGADNAGGVIRTLPREDSVIGRAIAEVYSHPFGVGSSYFRTGLREVREADTVAFGCWPKRVFEKVGLFDERLERSQDIEFNLRLKKAGGKIILVPEIVSYYYAPTTFSGMAKHRFRDGIWVTYPLKFGIRAFRLRHLIPLFFVLALAKFAISSLIFSPFVWAFLFLIVLYFTVTFLVSLQIAFKKKKPEFLFLLPICFLLVHVSYGLGSLVGFFKIIT